MLLSTFFLSFTALITPSFAQFDLDSSSNAVAICYSVWQSLGYDDGSPPDITDILQGDGSFQSIGDWHWWGRPDGGYYSGSNRTIYDRHFSQISGAGIDFIVIDATNLQGYGDYAVGLFTEPTNVLLDEMRNQRNAGLHTPYVVFWAGTASTDADSSAVPRFIHDTYYTNSTYSDFWVIYQGSPLLLTTDVIPGELNGTFTMRKMWGLQTSLANGEWSFLQDAPQNIGTYNGVSEEISVCTAKQATYISDAATATSRQEGQTYANQWMEAFNLHPKVVMLTWWNEWMAQRQENDANGNAQFVDEYDSEYSKDIEPQDPSQPTGHGSYYLEWTQQYVSAYKANQAIPTGLTGY